MPIPPVVEKSKRYPDAHAFRRDAEAMHSRGWEVAEARPVPRRPGPLARLFHWRASSRTVDVRYVRPRWDAPPG